ncbi:hypothetical protein N6H18_07275 [Reichenbachiella agarivorans]|uniref:Uncharacterized protein n=1 Tax=Reichenbachiella agarivorans TaxID=2979464 RepID=A0ABY6CTD3_9BACT|nr:hypothetical protein [Reichenbachiella agarivorans]UXP33753.1 hypothetical protein N6H18_07275 [Reichenbachiella agarivorans]
MLRVIFCTLFCLLYSVQTYSQPTHLVIKDLRHGWKSYDQEARSWQPYLSATPSNTILFQLDLNRFQGADLLLVVPPNHSLLINHQLILVTQRVDSLLWSVDSLRAYYQLPTINLEIFSKRIKESEIQTLIVKNGQAGVANSEAAGFDSRESSEDNNVMIMGVLFVFFVLAIFRTLVYRVYNEYFLLSRAFSVRQKFELIDSQSTMSPVNLGFIFLYSVFVGGLVLNLASQI